MGVTEDKGREGRKGWRKLQEIKKQSIFTRRTKKRTRSRINSALSRSKLVITSSRDNVFLYLKMGRRQREGWRLMKKVTHIISMKWRNKGGSSDSKRLINRRGIEA